MKKELAKAEICVIINAVNELFFPVIMRNINRALECARKLNKRISIVILVIKALNLFHMLRQKIKNKDISVIFVNANINLACGRNIGIRTCLANWTVFLDDDLLVSKDFFEKLLVLLSILKVKEINVVGITGDSTPFYITKKKNNYIGDYLLREFYWLIGCTYWEKNVNRFKLVDNLIGSNMIIKKSIFDRIGLFNGKLGFFHVGRKKVYIGGEDTELSYRIRKNRLGLLLYDQNLKSYHIILPEKIKIGRLLRRAFYYPLSIKKVLNELGQSENRIFLDAILQLNRNYIHNLLSKIFKLIKDFFFRFKKKNFGKLILTVLIMVSIFVGFIYSLFQDAMSKI